jgi:hypothetical protein
MEVSGQTGQTFALATRFLEQPNGSGSFVGENVYVFDFIIAVQLNQCKFSCERVAHVVFTASFTRSTLAAM